MRKITKFYEFRQNNSGGSFDVDDILCHIVVIEAESAEQANAIAKDLGIYFNGTEDETDCPCCGDRWSEVDEFDGEDLDSFTSSDVFISKYSRDKISPQFIDRIEPNLYSEYRDLDEEKVVVNNIEEYYQLKADMWGWTSPDVRIYYMNGTIKEIYPNKTK